MGRTTCREMIDQLKSKNLELDATSFFSQFQSNQPVIVLDVREREEVMLGMLPKARHIPRGLLEYSIEKAVPNPKTPIVVYCQGGVRSLFAAHTLTVMGYEHVKSLKGGFSNWRGQGFPIETNKNGPKVSISNPNWFWVCMCTLSFGIGVLLMVVRNFL